MRSLNGDCIKPAKHLIWERREERFLSGSRYIVRTMIPTRTIQDQVYYQVSSITCTAFNILLLTQPCSALHQNGRKETKYHATNYISVEMGSIYIHFNLLKAKCQVLGNS